jgi:hypothetical protein
MLKNADARSGGQIKRWLEFIKVCDFGMLFKGKTFRVKDMVERNLPALSKLFEPGATKKDICAYFENMVRVSV